MISLTQQFVSSHSSPYGQEQMLKGTSESMSLLRIGTLSPCSYALIEASQMGRTKDNDTEIYDIENGRD